MSGPVCVSNLFAFFILKCISLFWKCIWWFLNMFGCFKIFLVIWNEFSCFDLYLLVFFKYILLVFEWGQWASLCLKFICLFIVLYICLFFYIFGCFEMYLPVFVMYLVVVKHIWLFWNVFCFEIYLVVLTCIWLFGHVFGCFEMYLVVLKCIWLFWNVFGCFPNEVSGPVCSRVKSGQIDGRCLVNNFPIWMLFFFNISF